MIGQLCGQVVDKDMERVLLDVAGVGYEIACPLTVLDKVPPKGTQTTLAIHTHVREDQITLSGFSSFRSDKFFDS